MLFRPKEVVDVIEEYGPERVRVDCDLANSIQTERDTFLIRRLILDLLRLGVSPDSVRQVVHDNPADVLSLSYGEQ